MNITIQKPFSISEIGKRFNNEDSIYPGNELAGINNRLFLVCDGVGGSNKGEVASSIACDSIQTYFRSFIETNEAFDPKFIEKAIRYTEIRFDEYILNNPSAKGMATTLCLIYFAPAGVYLTHAGDSRIYQFRNGKMIYKTEDHSLVNSMIKSGKINPKDAEKHPQKNVIYRAIQGSHSPVEIDVIKITDVLPDDEFLMCTDGVTEVWSDDDLCKVFSENISSEEKISTIKESCRNKSRDNYSAYLIPIQEVNKMNVFKQIFLYAFMCSFLFGFFL